MLSDNIVFKEDIIKDDDGNVIHRRLEASIQKRLTISLPIDECISEHNLEIYFKEPMRHTFCKLLTGEARDVLRELYRDLLPHLCAMDLFHGVDIKTALDKIQRAIS